MTDVPSITVVVVSSSSKGPYSSPKPYRAMMIPVMFADGESEEDAVKRLIRAIMAHTAGYELVSVRTVPLNDLIVKEVMKG